MEDLFIWILIRKIWINWGLVSTLQWMSAFFLLSISFMLKIQVILGRLVLLPFPFFWL
ncbi:hypothetical protein KSP39_PZI018481 [Platanthera zijinensis]|uniref:Uncharacterized protein n=1 Tax=Platanthera zijinensis TaxID=2320716 RepID=A0AAP0FYT1_9ASPA